MSTIQIHQTTSYQEVPWRNGRGKTLVLQSEPIPGSDAFAWRLSIAGVEGDGPFSRFDDCDRTLILLDGKGLTLIHGNGKFDELNVRFAMAEFPGDIDTVATLHDGPIRDFNVICNRLRCSARIAVLGYGSNSLAVDSDVLLAYAVDGPVRVLQPPGPSVGIGHHELMQCDKPVHTRWAFTGGPLIVIRIHNL